MVIGLTNQHEWAAVAAVQGCCTADAQVTQLAPQLTVMQSLGTTLLPASSVLDITAYAPSCKHAEHQQPAAAWGPSAEALGCSQLALHMIKPESSSRYYHSIHLPTVHCAYSNILT